MRNVTLRRLAMTNFKGERSRATEFGSMETTIAGRNGLGKSRHFDAFVWLLFGKDRLDRKDYEIKTRIGGEELHKCECSVEGTISVDGEDITLKRSLVEDWVKPRGQAEQVYKGNHTECWWNDTPVNVGEYDKRVAGVIDASVFKMLTNPRYFASMNWKLQREQLFMLAGTVSDYEIAQSDADFKALMDRLNGKSLADFKAELCGKKKRLKIDLAQIQPRIDQTEKLKPEGEDFEELAKELASVEAHIVESDAEMADLAEARRKERVAEELALSRVHVMEREAQELVFKARNKAREEAFEAGARRREVEANIKSVDRSIAASRKAREDLVTRRTIAVNDIELLTRDQKKLRGDWQTENAKEWSGETTCPHCGQPLPEEMEEKARDVFMSAKQERLAEINRRGKSLGERIAKDTEDMADLDKLISGADAEIEALEAKRDTYEEALLSLPAVSEPKEVNPADIPGWSELQESIRKERENLKETPAEGLPEELRERRKALSQRKAELLTRLAGERRIEECDKEIASLEQRGRELAQQIADLEKEEYTAARFTRKRVEECEKRVNAMFRSVTFRLFDYTLEGNEVETCVPLIDGVPYGSANSAGQLNAGLDIINSLCRYYGVTAPVFIDNAEGVNEFIPTQSQMIYLRVTEDKELKITSN